MHPKSWTVRHDHLPRQKFNTLCAKLQLQRPNLLAALLESHHGIKRSGKSLFWQVMKYSKAAKRGWFRIYNMIKTVRKRYVW